MKYSNLFLIINILAVSVIYSAADDDLNDGVKKVSSRATITIKDNEKSSFVSSSATLDFADSDGNNINEVESGSEITVFIHANDNKKYPNGKVLSCKMYDEKNPTIYKTLIQKCTKDESIGDWIWDQEQQRFRAQLTANKLPDSTSDQFIIECEAVLCSNTCPSEYECSSRKRRHIPKTPFSLFFRHQKRG